MTRSLAARKPKKRRDESPELGGGLLPDSDNDKSVKVVKDTAIIPTGSAGASPGQMDSGAIKARLERIKSSLKSSNVLQKADVDFLAQIDKSNRGAYREANRLLADFYFRLKDYRRQAKSLEIATARGKYKHDPKILLSLAKSYARVKSYRKALSTMRRVERKMRRLPAREKADALRFYAEILEFEFLRQFHEDAKRANLTLVDKSIQKWESYRTFSRGTSAGAVAKAQKKIRELNELKSRVQTSRIIYSPSSRTLMFLGKMKVEDWGADLLRAVEKLRRDPVHKASTLFACSHVRPHL